LGAVGARAARRLPIDFLGSGGAQLLHLRFDALTVRGYACIAPNHAAILHAALAFALRYLGRKRVHNADEIMSEIVAKRLVEYLERAGFVVMKIGGGAALGRGFEG
jgi:hypothetical protein